MVIYLKRSIVLVVIILLTLSHGVMASDNVTKEIGLGQLSGEGGPAPLGAGGSGSGSGCCADNYFDVGCYIYRSWVQTIPDNTWTLLQYDGESLDCLDMFDDSSNNTRIYIKRDGIYSFDCMVHWSAAPGDTLISHQIYKNGVYFRDIYNGPYTTLKFDWGGIMELSEGDYIEFKAWQNSGTVLNISGGQGYADIQLWRLNVPEVCGMFNAVAEQISLLGMGIICFVSALFFRKAWIWLISLPIWYGVITGFSNGAIQTIAGFMIVVSAVQIWKNWRGLLKW